MSANRFTKSNQISENQFVGLVFDYVMCTSARDCHEKLGLSTQTINKKYRELSRRILTDSSIDPIIADMPEIDDPIWMILYDCVFDCPKASTKSVFRPTAAIFPSRYETQSSQIRAADYRDIDFKTRGRSKGCAGCHFGHDRLQDSVIHLLYDLKTQQLGAWRKSDFPLHFVRALICAGLQSRRTDRVFRGNPTQYVRRILESLMRDKI